MCVQSVPSLNTELSDGRGKETDVRSDSEGSNASGAGCVGSYTMLGDLWVQHVCQMSVMGEKILQALSSQNCAVCIQDFNVAALDNPCVECGEYSWWKMAFPAYRAG